MSNQSANVKTTLQDTGEDRDKGNGALDNNKICHNWFNAFYIKEKDWVWHQTRYNALLNTWIFPSVRFVLFISIFVRFIRKKSEFIIS